MLAGDLLRDAALPRSRRACTSRAVPAAVSAPPAPAPQQHAVPRPRAPGDAIRADFPILHQSVCGRCGARAAAALSRRVAPTLASPRSPLVYLDNAATSQKPQSVIDALANYYSVDNANVHRGVHTLAARATTAYEDARSKVAAFIGARPSEIVFTRGATEAINLVAWSWGALLRPGDEVALSVAEHHSNLVPWQLLARRTGCVLRFAPLDAAAGQVIADGWRSVIGPRCKLVATAHVSNVLASSAPVEAIVEMAAAVGARVLLDACQSVPARPVDVGSLGVDFLVASGHKMCGPTGIGFLWAKPEVLEGMPPWQGGGEMIDTVSLETATFAPPPTRFEAGTPHIAGAIGLGAACDYLSSLGMRNIADHEDELAGVLYDRLRSKVPGLRVIGPSAGRAALAAFTVDGLHATDISTLCDLQGLALRSGHHCTQPLHAALGVASSCRASAYIYNTITECEGAADTVADVAKFLREAGA